MRLKAVQAFNTLKDAHAITKVRAFIFDVQHTDTKSQLTLLRVSFARSLNKRTPWRIQMDVVQLQHGIFRPDTTRFPN